MRFIDILEAKHFGKVSNIQLMRLAKQEPSFVHHWLVHAIRSNATQVELESALADAITHQLPVLREFNEYFEWLNEKNTVEDYLRCINLPALTTTKLGQAQITETLLNAQLDKIIELAEPHIQPAQVFTQATEQNVASIRNNKETTTNIPNDSLVLALTEREITSSVGIDISYAEPPVIIRYAEDEYYKWHFDAIDGRGEAAKRQLNEFGQRYTTAILYLNDNFVGGETEFKAPNLKVTPKKGSVLSFKNTGENQKTLPESLHRGCKVESGHKWIVTLWFRDKPLWFRKGLF